MAFGGEDICGRFARKLANDFHYRIVSYRYQGVYRMEEDQLSVKAHDSNYQLLIRSVFFFLEEPWNRKRLKED